MKNLQKLKWLLILFGIVTIVQSCAKDEIKRDEVEDNSEIEASKNIEDTNSNTTSGEEGDITLYKVDGNNLVREKDYTVIDRNLEFQKDTSKHQEVWELVKKIVPADYLVKLSGFMIFSGKSNGTAGYVYHTELDLSKWRMGIAIDYAYEGGFNTDGELAYTIIHEFGHILTLDKVQVDSSVVESNCLNFFTGEGCARTSSYINKLQKNFWLDIWSKFETAQDSESKMQDFYNQYSNRFVTDYASTNPGEDIAEVFATFVTRNGEVNGNSIAEQKIQLMYDHKQLVEFRNFIRRNMTSAKGRSYLPIAGSWKRAKTIGNPKKGCQYKSL